MFKTDKNKDIAVIKKDEGFVILYGKPYEVNQKTPSMELIAKCSLIKEPIKHIEREMSRYSKMIDIIKDEEDKILTKQSFTEEDLKKIEELEKRIDEYKLKSVSPISDLSQAVYEMLNWLLGKEAVKIIKEKDMPYTDLMDILSMASEESPFLKEYVKR